MSNQTSTKFDKDAALEQLEQSLIKELTLQINSGEVSPSTLSVAQRLLKDYGFTSRIDTDSEITSLMQLMSKESKTNTVEDIVAEIAEFRDI